MMSEPLFGETNAVRDRLQAEGHDSICYAFEGGYCSCSLSKNNSGWTNKLKESQIVYVRIPVRVDYVGTDVVGVTPQSVWDDDPEGLYNNMEEFYVKREWIEQGAKYV